MPTNMMQIISLMKNGGNPQQMVLNMLEQQTENNPFAANSNTRAILEAIQQNKVDAMQDKITELTAQLTSANLAASQAAQNAYLVNELRPSPVPAYITANPYCNCGNCCGTLA